jgi:hypothetical protein
MEALRAFVSHSASVAEASPSFNTTVPTKASTITSPEGSKTITKDELFLKTKYGLLISFEEPISVRSITLPGTSTTTTSALQADSPLSGAETSPTNITNPGTRLGGAETKPHAPRYRYKLFPEWQTSGLWYDTSWPQNPKDEYHVDLEDIERRYPELYPYYDAWEESYEVEFETQGLHLGGTHPVFKDKVASDAWLLEGLLMAFWIALQDDVDQVVYEPGGIAYVIRREATETASTLDSKKKDAEDVKMEKCGDMRRIFEEFLRNLPDIY